MGYRIPLDRGVLRAELFGRETVEQTKAFFKAVVSASRETGCPCVLISVRSSKPIFQLERHGLIDYFRELSVTSSRRVALLGDTRDRKSTRLNSSHLVISYAVFCLKKKKKNKLHSLARYITRHYTARHHTLD